MRQALPRRKRASALADDLVAARRQVDGLLEEHVGPGQRRAQRRQQIESSDSGSGDERGGESLGRGVAHQLAAGLGDRSRSRP